MAGAGTEPGDPDLEQIHRIVTRTVTSASYQDFLHRQAEDDGLSSFAEPSHTEIQAAPAVPRPAFPAPGEHVRPSETSAHVAQSRPSSVFEQRDLTWITSAKLFTL
jgi:hypothetical protein